jgi:dihydropteroate synthase
MRRDEACSLGATMRALVMGVVNVTPDSFSDGGLFFEPAAAVAHGLDLVDQGADIIDVGGESTRPGAMPVDPDEECRRILPVIEALADRIRVSVDTRNESTARTAVAAGATLINDVSASLWPVAAETGAGWIALHMAGEPATMQVDPRYDDVVPDVRGFLVLRAERAVAAGVDEVWIDPGIGFGKSVDHNLALLAHLDSFVATGFPVVVGTSRKGFLGTLLGRSDARAAQPGLPGMTTVSPVPTVAATAVDDRIEASLASATWALAQGVRMVRVHDVAPTVQAAVLVD